MEKLKIILIFHDQSQLRSHFTTTRMKQSLLRPLTPADLPRFTRQHLTTGHVFLDTKCSRASAHNPLIWTPSPSDRYNIGQCVFQVLELRGVNGNGLNKKLVFSPQVQIPWRFHTYMQLASLQSSSVFPSHLCYWGQGPEASILNLEGDESNFVIGKINTRCHQVCMTID